jgi:hypothetical protein
LLDNAIKNLAKTVPVESEFTWKIPDECPINIPDDIEGLFQRNIYLKENLGEKLRGDESFDSHFWLMNKWGRTGLGNNDANRQYLRNFLQELPTGRLSYQSYGRIPSFSKVAAFMYPEKYSIYDSRVIYTLNWLIFRHTQDRLFFFQPPSRNGALDKYSTTALYNLSGQADYSRPKQTAYQQYCDQVLDISKRVLGHEKPYYLEMLLFAAAPTWVPMDVVKNTKITIATDYP